jgi:DNA polymerase III sliding clamp (beta) subunit (PCNA family)
MAVQVSKDGMVASNGSVTALYREGFDVDTFCISSSCLSDLISVMASSTVETVEIFEEEAYLVFKFGDNVFFTRKTNVTFPDVFNKIDKPTQENNKQVLKFKNKELAKALKRISLTAPDDTRVVKFEIADSTMMRISARDNKDFFSEETVSYTSDGFDITKPLKIYFNYMLILDVLSKMASEEIEFKFNFDMLRMPVRVDEDKTTVFLMRSAPPNGDEE